MAEPTKRKKWSDVKARLVDRIHPEPLLEYRAVVLPADPAHGQIEGSVEIAGGERSSRWTDARTPIRVLLALLDSGGRVVTREQLGHRLWPDDVFVDFDRAINKAVCELRRAVGSVRGAEARRNRLQERIPARRRTE